MTVFCAQIETVDRELKHQNQNFDKKTDFCRIILLILGILNT